MEDRNNDFVFQTKHRYGPSYEADTCTQATLEDLYLKLGMSYLKENMFLKLSANSAFSFLTLYLKTKTRNPRKASKTFI